MLPGRAPDRQQSLSAPRLGPLWLVVFAFTAAAVLGAPRPTCAGQDQPPSQLPARPAPRPDSQVQQAVYSTGSGGGQLKWLPRTTQTVTLASRPAAPARVPSSAAQGPLIPSAMLSPAGQPFEQTAIGPYPSSGLPQVSTAQTQADPFADPFEERSAAGAPGIGLPRGGAPGIGLPGSSAPSLPTPLPSVREGESLGEGLPEGFGGSLPEIVPIEPVPRPTGPARQSRTEPYGLPQAKAGALPFGQAGQLDQPEIATGSGQTGYVFGPEGVKFRCPTPQDKEFYRPLADLSVDILPPDAGRKPLPPECAVSEERLDPNQPRPWAPLTFTWKASGLCHKPLYFQQRHVERYGHSWGALLQPAMSHANFYASVIALPYKMGLTPPNECQYTLGFYRPNSCAPYMLDPLPLSVRAGLGEAGAWVGGVFLMP